MAVALTKYDSFNAAAYNKVHDLANDTLKYVFSNTTPNDATHTDLGDVTAITMTNLNDGEVNVTSSTQSGGDYKLILEDKLFTATGAVPQFQYVILYNDTATNKELIGYYDYGSAVDMLDTNTFNIDNDPSAGVFTNT